MAPPLRVVLDESVPADLTTLDALARLQLEARRQGFEIRLLEVPEALRKLIDFAGLRDVLCVEVRRKAEEREQRLGVEEERELDDPPVA